MDEQSTQGVSGGASSSPNYAESTTQSPSSKDSFSVNSPAISLPKGGGAIRGIGEKFAANPVTGTGSLSVPIATSPGRSGFGPQLNLSYDSGAGNGPFGLGWNLSLPSITRKTDKGLPQYRDFEESDEFILSGAEDLVPILVKDHTGEWIKENIPARDLNGETYNIQRYRPRTEGLFARIERWSNQNNLADVFWRSISKDNITTWYGKTKQSRIFDPENDGRIFSWLICESYDDKGNAIVYEHIEEDSSNINDTLSSERNRTNSSRSADHYLKRIKYGNKISRLIQPDLTTQEWMFEVVFDYDEGHYNLLDPDTEGRQFVEVDINDQFENGNRKWKTRRDPFSSYRSGFEVRTYRLCHRVLMFHHFDELESPDYLVRSTEFHYNEGPISSVIDNVTQSGYIHDHDNVYFKKSLPPLEFGYTSAKIQRELKEIDPESLENLPQGLDGSQYRWADIDGEGAGGILTEQNGAWYYKRNLSPLTLDNESTEEPTVKLGPMETITPLPGFSNITNGQQQIMDLAGDGQIDVVSYEEPLPGFYERTDNGNWKPFKAFELLPNINFKNPNLKFVDLTGDGHADILITEDQAFSWYASLSEQGFAPSKKLQQAIDEDAGPRLVFADGTDSIYLSDMSGDGLTDLVRIRNGEVSYWPNLGYCRFGRKVTMDNTSRFDSPDQFDQKRIRLADIDGSGVTDILYLNHDRVDIYLNESGNSWTYVDPLTHLPAIDNASNVMAVDLMGNGTACLVWSSPLIANAQSPMKYIDLMGGQKPHLLNGVVNNLGSETRIHYAPSTKFYLQDKQQGKEWITRLHFPVHVVEKVEIYDHISRNRFVSRYAYHHGYFDGHEREFRGFSMVEQWDTEAFASLSDSNEFPEGDNTNAASHIPPVHTKTWFHTGAYLKRHHISNYFAGFLNEHDTGEYFREPGISDEDAQKRLLPDTELPDDIHSYEEREACRSLKGQMLRQEVYAIDGTDKQQYPYTVTEHNFTIKRLQPKQGNQHAVFFIHAREILNYHYERDPEDPRIQHAMTLHVDDYGNVLTSSAIGYGRRNNKSHDHLELQDRDKQQLIHITCTESLFTNSITEENDHYRAPLPAESCSYEIRKAEQEESTDEFSLFKFDELLEFIQQARDDDHDIEYEDIDFSRAKTIVANDPGERDKYFRRLIEQVKTIYRSNDLSGPLPFQELESLALPYESYKLAFTPSLIQQVYTRDEQPLIENITTVLGGKSSDQGGYVDLDNNNHWWIPSGRSYFKDTANLEDNAITAAEELLEAQENFFLPRKFVDPFNNTSFVKYDNYDLLLLETKDALNNLTTVGLRNEDYTLAKQGNNYRVLLAEVMMGPNGNATKVAFDTLGLVVATAVMGKPGYNQGDLIDNSFIVEPTKQLLTDFFANPRGDPAYDLLAKATSRIVYDIDRFYRSRKANPEDKIRWLPGFAATIVREDHTSDLANPNSRDFNIQVSFSYSDGFGREIQKKIQAEPEEGSTTLRWVGSGWTIFNNKGKPVQQYEPFFTYTHDFEFDREQGVSPILFYDPVGRVVATIHPNHSFEKVVFNPWLQITYDVNDTISIDPRVDDHLSPFLFNSDNTQRLSEDQYYPSWYQLRTNATHSTKFEKKYPNVINRQYQVEAAEKSLAHANTPTTAHMDALGRPFLTVVKNKVQCTDHALDGAEHLIKTRVELDIEGNQHAVRDADPRAVDENGIEITDELGRIVMQYAYYMVGPEQNQEGTPNRIYQLSMEAGARWSLYDVTGNPIRTWDSRGHTTRVNYDALHRPLRNWVSGIDQNNPTQEFLTERLIYGEQHPDAKDLNLLGKLYIHLDQAGVVSTDDFDFKGNLKQATRRLATEYKQTICWDAVNAIIPNDSATLIDLTTLETTLTPLLETEPFTSITTYDALNRTQTSTSPDGSIYLPKYNEANLLESVNVKLRGAANETPFVVNINYDAKGQRKFIEYGCGTAANQQGVTTRYDYDPETFRLTHMHTIRPENSNGLAADLFIDPKTIQDLHYTYDPVGNITHIADNALKTISYADETIKPVCRFDYDAIYRLLKATGREHIGQADYMPEPSSNNCRDYPRAGIHNIGDVQAIRNYKEFYQYDVTGNFEEMVHKAKQGIWTRVYHYDETSLIEANKKSNRLSSAPFKSELPITEKQFTYDKHGSITKMPHLSLIQWDYRDQLQATAQQEVNNGIPEITWYVYDASGQRVRKVTESMVNEQGMNNDDEPYRMKQRIYLGGFEIYTEFENDGETEKLKRRSLHIMDDKQSIALVETKTIDTSDITHLNTALQRYQLGNHLGSAALELAEDGELISYEEYRPYGMTAFQAGRNVAETSLKRYRYSGKERDDENGFYYYGARYFASWLGRWTATDPSMLIDGTNLYIYSRNSPITRKDLTGRNSGFVWPSAADVWQGIKNIPDAILEPLYIVEDLVFMGLATAVGEEVPVDVIAPHMSSTSQELIHLENKGGTEGEKARAALLPAASIATGGAAALEMNILRVYEENMSPEEASKVLTQGAATQAGLAGLGVGLAKATGNRATGRAPKASSESLQSAMNETTQARVVLENNAAAGKSGKAAKSAVNKTGDATLGKPLDMKGPVIESIENGGPKGHVEMQNARAGSRVMFQDKATCGDCISSFRKGEMTNSVRTYTLRDPNHPNRSTKTVAQKLARGKGEAVVVEDFVMHMKPPLGAIMPVSESSDESLMSIDPTLPTQAEIEAMQSLPEPLRYN